MQNPDLVLFATFIMTSGAILIINRSSMGEIAAVTFERSGRRKAEYTRPFWTMFSLVEGAMILALGVGLAVYGAVFSEPSAGDGRSGLQLREAGILAAVLTAAGVAVGLGHRRLAAMMAAAGKRRRGNRAWLRTDLLTRRVYWCMGFFVAQVGIAPLVMALVV